MDEKRVGAERRRARVRRRRGERYVWSALNKFTLF